MTAFPLDVAIVATGVANLASVRAALVRAGARPRLTTSADDVLTASAVLLPGVGAFDPARETLARHGIDDALRERITNGRPTLAICLGLQLLCESSEESLRDLRGLSVLDGRIERFHGDVLVPQLGWNAVVSDADCRILASGFAYFANSYRLAVRPKGCRAAITDHGGAFVAVVERGALVACQFHPELSGACGQALLRRFVQSARESVEC